MYLYTARIGGYLPYSFNGGPVRFTGRLYH